MNFNFGVLDLCFLTFALIAILAGILQIITGKGFVINPKKYSDEDFKKVAFPTALLAIACGIFIIITCFAHIGYFSSFIQVATTMLAAVCIACGWLLTKQYT
jgi:hypothetical protein